MRLTTVDNIKNVAMGYPRGGYVYVGRGSKWGNPFPIDPDHDRADVIERYKRWLLAQPELVVSALVELAGKTLLCYCHPLPCHGDVLADMVNSNKKMMAAGWAELRKVEYNPEGERGA